MQHRETITDIIHEVVGVMGDSLEVSIAKDSFEIKETSNSVLVKLIANFNGADGAREYSDITLNIMAWGQVRIIKIDTPNLQVRMIVNEFIKLFSESYQKALDNDKADKHSSQAVKNLLDRLILEKLTGIKVSNNLNETKSKFELIKNILALA